jgi:hypothetical protein
MLRRAWLVLSVGWFALFMWAGSSREAGALPGDYALALFPAVAGPLLLWITRFIVRGSVRPAPVSKPFRRF